MAETIASADTDRDRLLTIRAKLSASPRPRDSNPATALRCAIAATAATTTSVTVSQSSGCFSTTSRRPFVSASRTNVPASSHQVRRIEASPDPWRLGGDGGAALTVA